jgi:hypothetical protein
MEFSLFENATLLIKMKKFSKSTVKFTLNLILSPKIPLQIGLGPAWNIFIGNPIILGIAWDRA